MGDALDRINASYHGLMKVIEGVPDERLASPNAVGEWSVKDLLAHTAYWNEQALDQSERRLRGEVVEDYSGDWQAVNERVQHERAGWSLDRIRVNLKQVHDRFVEMTSNHPDLSPQELGLSIYEHVDEHAAEIRAWRAQVVA